MRTWLYYLRDPRSGEIRYVGVTCDPHTRMLCHLRAKSDTHRDRWIRSLLLDGLGPEIELVHQFATREHAGLAEILTIETLSKLGVCLTNLADGGQGGAAHRQPHTEEAKAKMAKAKLGRRHSLEHCKAISDGHKNYTKTPEHQAAITAGMQHRKPLSQEVRDGISAKLVAFNAAKRAAQQKGI